MARTTLHLPRVTGRALDNARRAADALRATVSTRNELAQRLETAGEHGDLALLTEKECLALLETRSFGRLAYIARDGLPDIVPVNYALDGPRILVRTGPGPKLQAAQRREQVAFEVDAIDEQTHTGWTVVVHGLADVVPPERPRSYEPEPWAAGPRAHTMRITIRRATGRHLL